MQRYYDPKNDVAFKKIFGCEEHKDFLIDFLDGALGHEGKTCIESVEFLNPIQVPWVEAGKTSVVDIICKDQNGERYVVEMQVASAPGFKKRTLYYGANVYINQLEKGKDYRHLKPVTVLVIADHILFKDKPEYKSNHSIQCNQHHTNDLEDFRYVFFELPKFHKQEHELLSNEDRWLYFLKYADRETELPKVFAGTTIERAFATVDIGAWSEAERYGYINAVSARADAESRLEEALKKGLEKGKKEANLETARRFYALGLSDEMIIQGTGISKDDLWALKK